MEPTSRIKTCPLNGKLCVDGVRSDFEFLETAGVKRQIACQWWLGMAGKDPQSNAPINEYGCAVTWQAIIGLENSQMTRHVVAQVSEGTKAFVDALPEEAQKQVFSRASQGLLKTMLAESVDKLLEPAKNEPKQLDKPKE